MRADRRHILRMLHAETPSSPPILFAPGVGEGSAHESIRLDEEETRHLRALRLAPGAAVRLTDGRGVLWAGHLAEAAGRGALCVLHERLVPPPALPLTLAFGVGNKKHSLWLVEKATELGVRTLQPVEFERSRSVADAARSPSFWAKAERRAVAALKQSGGAWLPDVRMPCPLRDFVDRAVAGPPGSRDRTGASGSLVLLDALGEPLASALGEWSGGGPLVILAGPEGGLVESETDQLKRGGFVPARLASTVLRFETAAIGAAIVAAQHLELARTACRVPDEASHRAGG